MKNAYTKKVTDRFIQAVNMIIYENKLKGGELDNIAAFARSIGQTPQNFSKVYKYGQLASSPFIESVARIHGVNPTWLYLNRGEMFLKDEARGDDIASLSRQLRSIAAKLEQHKETKLRRVK